MKLITTKKLCEGVAKRWRSQYKENYGDGKYENYQQLLALKGKGTKKQIEDIIGNSSWTSLRCGECEKDVNAVVRLGDEPDYESSTVWVCKRCLKKAINL